MSLASFKFNADILSLIVKSNSSSNVNLYKSLLLHYFYGNSLTEYLSICSRHIIECISVKFKQNANLVVIIAVLHLHVHQV